MIKFFFNFVCFLYSHRRMLIWRSRLAGCFIHAIYIAIVWTKQIFWRRKSPFKNTEWNDLSLCKRESSNIKQTYSIFFSLCTKFSFFFCDLHNSRWNMTWTYFPFKLIDCRQQQRRKIKEIIRHSGFCCLILLYSMISHVFFRLYELIFIDEIDHLQSDSINSGFNSFAFFIWIFTFVRQTFC